MPTMRYLLARVALVLSCVCIHLEHCEFTALLQLSRDCHSNFSATAERRFNTRVIIRKRVFWYDQLLDSLKYFSSAGEPQFLADSSAQVSTSCMETPAFVKTNYM